MVVRASVECRKTCSVVRLLSQRSRFGYGYNIDKLLRKPQEGEMGLDDHKQVLDEKFLEEDVTLVEGVLDGALGAFSEYGCCCGDGVFKSSSIRGRLGGMMTLFDPADFMGFVCLNNKWTYASIKNVISSTVEMKIQRFLIMISDDGNKVDEDPSKGSEFNDQVKEENVNNTNNVNVIGTNEVNTIGENISSELLFDTDLPALEDISTFYFSNEDEDDNAMADMNNSDTTI
nr:hypothetical protein [Tanacetum cinerariifolium]GEZ38911.1 hypothetical protein [Tanacetum cinerariifolium]